MINQDPIEPVVPSATGKDKKSRTLLYVIIGALLIAIIILLIFLLNKTGETTSPEPVPATTASVAPANSATTTAPSPITGATETTSSPSDEPDPDPTSATSTSTGPQFASFDAPTTEGGCSMGGPSFTPTPPLVKVTWAAAGAEEAWFVQGTSDAADSGYMQIPLDGNQDDFPYEQEFSCSSDSTTFTITLVGSDGTHVSKSWTVQNTGDVF